MAVAAMLAGCAYISAVPVEPGSHVAGIRVYDVKPIMVVRADSYTIELIPNYNRAYALKFGAFLSKNETTVQMPRGMVTSVDANLDSTEIIKLLQTVAQRVIPQAGQATGGGAELGSVFAVYEFRFDDEGELIGLFQLPLSSYPPLARAGDVEQPPPVVQN